MTDDNPSPTTRTPIPEPRADDAPTEGWPGTTAPIEPAPPEWDATPPPVPPSPTSPPPPPVAPPPRREEPDRGRTTSILFGLVILGIGLWFLAEHTLGLELPRIRWSQLWPVVLIGVGLWVVLGSIRRGTR